MVKEIIKDVFKIASDSNVYIILDNKTIIDTSDIKFRDLIKKEIQRIIPLDKVKTVLLTHLHFDHVGNLDLFPNAKVYASKDDLESFRENPNNFFLEGISKTSIEMLNNAKELPKDISKLKVIPVPGHTPGSVAFFDEKRKLLFSGDTLFFNGGIGRTDFGNSIPDNMDESVAKLQNLASIKDLKLCPGHNY